MTVKELKERLEIILEDDKGHYLVFAGNSIDDVKITVTDFYNEVIISSIDD